jgi:hypothetical protein
MIPLNIYLQDATREQIEHAVVEYGNAIKDLVAANIFPGDMLWKNFGVTRHGKVVFYDYDEIEYITDCNFRRVPEPAQRGRGDVRRGLVPRGPEGRVPRDLRPLPAGQHAGARGVHEAPRRPAGRRLLAGPQGAHPRRPRARRVPLRARQALRHQRQAERARPGSDVPRFLANVHLRRCPPPTPPEGAMPCPIPSSSSPPPARPSAACWATFSNLAAWELGAVAIKAAVERAGVPGDAVDEVLMGNCLMAGQGQAPARQAMRKAGLPDSTGAVTLSKMCGSGMRAMMFAHDMLAAGSAT